MSEPTTTNLTWEKARDGAISILEARAVSEMISCDRAVAAGRLNVAECRRASAEALTDSANRIREMKP
jgi:hypothetical protein